MPQGPDFPGGPIIMNKANHQGRMTYHLLKIDGQHEQLLKTLPPESLPNIGNCSVANS